MCRSTPAPAGDRAARRLLANWCRFPAPMWTASGIARCAAAVMGACSIFPAASGAAMRRRWACSVAMRPRRTRLRPARSGQRRLSLLHLRTRRRHDGELSPARFHVAGGHRIPGPGQTRLGRESPGILHVSRRPKSRRQTDQPQRDAGDQLLERSAGEKLRLPGAHRRIRPGTRALPLVAPARFVFARLRSRTFRHDVTNAQLARFAQLGRAFRWRQRLPLREPLSAFVAATEPGKHPVPNQACRRRHHRAIRAGHRSLQQPLFLAAQPGSWRRKTDLRLRPADLPAQ